MAEYSEQYHNKYTRDPEKYDGATISSFAHKIIQRYQVDTNYIDTDNTIRTEEICTESALITIYETQVDDGTLQHDYTVNRHDSIGSAVYITSTTSPYVYINREGGGQCQVSDTYAYDTVELMGLLREIPDVEEPMISRQGERVFRTIVAKMAVGDAMSEWEIDPELFARSSESYSLRDINLHINTMTLALESGVTYDGKKYYYGATPGEISTLLEDYADRKSKAQRQLGASAPLKQLESKKDTP